MEPTDINTIGDDVLSCIMKMLPYETFAQKARRVCRRWIDIIKNDPVLKNRIQLFDFLRLLTRHYSALQLSKMEKVGLLQHTRCFINATSRRTAWATWNSLTTEDKAVWQNKFLCKYTTNRRTTQILTVFSVMQMLIAEKQ